MASPTRRALLPWTCLEHWTASAAATGVTRSQTLVCQRQQRKRGLYHLRNLWQRTTGRLRSEVEYCPSHWKDTKIKV